MHPNKIQLVTNQQLVYGVNFTAQFRAYERPKATQHSIIIDLCLTLSICSKVVVETMVAGASSMIFWWRRWMEQSLPNREIALPYWSARICTSRWRACTASCMMKIGEPGTSACTCIEEQTHCDTV